MGGYWSAYWHKGFIYGTEIARGLDVLQLSPSDYLTQNEIDAASLVSPYTFNAQQQRRIDWPAHPAVAHAYLDQLSRSDSIAGDQAQAVMDVLDRIVAVEPGQGASTADELETIATELTLDSTTANGRSQARTSPCQTAPASATSTSGHVPAVSHREQRRLTVDRGHPLLDQDAACRRCSWIGKSPSDPHNVRESASEAFFSNSNGGVLRQVQQEGTAEEAHGRCSGHRPQNQQIPPGAQFDTQRLEGDHGVSLGLGPVPIQHAECRRLSGERQLSQRKDGQHLRAVSLDRVSDQPDELRRVVDASAVGRADETGQPNEGIPQSAPVLRRHDLASGIILTPGISFGNRIWSQTGPTCAIPKT